MRRAVITASLDLARRPVDATTRVLPDGEPRATDGRRLVHRPGRRVDCGRLLGGSSETTSCGQTAGDGPWRLTEHARAVKLRTDAAAKRAEADAPGRGAGRGRRGATGTAGRDAEAEQADASRLQADRETAQATAAAAHPATSRPPDAPSRPPSTR